MVYFTFGSYREVLQERDLLMICILFSLLRHNTLTVKNNSLALNDLKVLKRHKYGMELAFSSGKLRESSRVVIFGIKTGLQAGMFGWRNIRSGDPKLSGISLTSYTLAKAWHDDYLNRRQPSSTVLATKHLTSINLQNSNYGNDGTNDTLMLLDVVGLSISLPIISCESYVRVNCEEDRERVHSSDTAMNINRRVAAISMLQLLNDKFAPNKRDILLFIIFLFWVTFFYVS